MIYKYPIVASSYSMAIVESEVAVGCPVPPYTPHAISVSLPKWRDNVGYEEGEKRVIDCMVNGYPRFFIHLSIVKVSNTDIFSFKHPLTF